MNLTRELFGQDKAEISAIPGQGNGKSFSAFGDPNQLSVRKMDESSNISRLADDVNDSDR